MCWTSKQINHTGCAPCLANVMETAFSGRQERGNLVTASPTARDEHIQVTFCTSSQTNGVGHCNRTHRFWVSLASTEAALQEQHPSQQLYEHQSAAASPSRFTTPPVPCPFAPDPDALSSGRGAAPHQRFVQCLANSSSQCRNAGAMKSSPSCRQVWYAFKHFACISAAMVPCGLRGRCTHHHSWCLLRQQQSAPSARPNTQTPTAPPCLPSNHYQERCAIENVSRSAQVS